uniref:HIT domain-containing protein n=1 Tax=Cannabis sativa TaxID=3483 RepID=A0A803Q441_CANSA
MLARTTSFGVLVVTQSFLGHVAELDLAAFALVQTLFLRFINGIILGMSSATETLCGQAYGAKQYHMMGIYLQRSWIVNIITATITFPLFIFSTQILRALGEEEDIAVATGQISIWCIPYLYYFVFSFTIQMYLQAQLKNMVVGWLSASSFVLHVLLSWFFVYKLNWGVAGALGGLNIASWASVIGQFIYIFGGWCPNSWKGFTTAAFSDMWPVVKLSVSSGLMLCLELWYNSILVLLAGYMKDATTAISAFSICLNISAWEFMICLGFLGAAWSRFAVLNSHFSTTLFPPKPSLLSTSMASEKEAALAALPSDSPTIFDKIISKEIPSTVVFEDDKVLAFRDISPQAPTHILIIPKVKDGLTGLSQAEERHCDILGRLLYTAKLVAKQEGLDDGYRIVINDGPQGCLYS